MTSTMRQQADEKSDLFDGVEHHLELPSKKFAIGSATITKEAGDRPGKPASLTAHAELRLCWSVMKMKESGGINFSTSPCSDSAKNQERNLQKISPNSQTERHPLSVPALKVIWKGSFEVIDFSYDNRLCDGFLAHPSAKISRKAYDFARQIAEVLQFRIHPRHAFWPEIFQLDCPDTSDIALYFYPGKIERSRRQYASLLKHIEKHDLMLRSRMGRVELLIFPSKLLHTDCQKLDGSYFMWGVFRCLKGKKVSFKEEAALPRLSAGARKLTLCNRGRLLEGQNSST